MQEKHQGGHSLLLVSRRLTGRRLDGRVLALAAVLVLPSCDGGSSPASPSRGTTTTALPASQTNNVLCRTFTDLRPGSGIQFDFQLPSAGSLRAVADWTDQATNLDLYLGYWGCPSIDALLRGGCVSLQSETGTSKPAEFTLNITGHDLTVDPSAPGKRIIYVYNRGPSAVSGVLQATMTTQGNPPTGGPDCASVPTSTTTTTVPTTTTTSVLPSDACKGDIPPSVPCGTPTAKCRDGTWSCSQQRSGTCSSHGGVECWVCPGVLCTP